MPRKKKKSNNYLWIFFIVFVGLLFAAVFYSSDDADKEDDKVVVEEEMEKDGNMEKELAPKSKQDNDVQEDKERNKEEVSSGEDEEEKSESEEKDEVTKTEENSDGNIYKASFASESLSFEYPLDWSVHQLEEKNKFSFAPKGKAVAEEYQGDIIIAYKENEQEVPIERFYDGLNDINLFEDASGGFDKEKSGEYDFYRFKEVVGYTSSTVGVFILDDFFVEMTDVYNKHQEDGVFDQLKQSFRAG